MPFIKRYGKRKGRTSRRRRGMRRVQVPRRHRAALDIPQHMFLKHRYVTSGSSGVAAATGTTLTFQSSLWDPVPGSTGNASAAHWAEWSA